MDKNDNKNTRTGSFENTDTECGPDTKFEEWKNMHEFFTGTESDKQNNSRSPANPPDVTAPNWAASERAFFKKKISHEWGTDKINRDDEFREDSS